MPRLKIDTRILGSNGTQVSEVNLFKGSAKHQYPHIPNVIPLVHFVARKLSIIYLMVIVDIKHNSNLCCVDDNDCSNIRYNLRGKDYVKISHTSSDTQTPSYRTIPSLLYTEL